ncbi:MAG: MerR family DNA-binding transcriptional regulator [Streptosporangiales bacterium]|nr:MerR family DNA-binding transcriptional regulator [Streptosporangiales bacterium]
MPDYQIGRAAQLLGVSADTLRRWIDAGRLASSRDAAGRRVIAGADLAAFAVTISESGEHPLARPRTSARNTFPGLVTRVLRGDVMAQVEVQAGAHRVVSLLSTEAVDELGLEPGVEAIACVKATNVTVEVPSS